jgi:tetratricopeptide (TPR) repeat protein
MTQAAPERHPEIPGEATWLADQEKWETRSGEEVRLYRPDGTLYMVSRHCDGVPEGEFQVFHPDGQIAKRGHYRAGNLEGDLYAFASDSELGEPLRGCCVPEGARQLRARYEKGELLYEKFLDADGRALLSDGSLCPSRPEALPELAQFDESERRWVVGPDANGQSATPDALWRVYDEGGTLVEEARFDEGFKVMSRCLSGDGQTREELHLSRQGRRSGLYRRRFAPDEQSPYRDGRVVEVRGEFADDLPVGRWTFHDAAGEVVRAVDHGRPLPADALAHPVFADELRPPEVWLELGESLLAEGRPAEALCAAARSAGRKGEADDLIAMLARHTVPLVSAEAAALAERAIAVEVEPVPALLSALIAGGEPAALFRALATAQRESPHAGRDFADAAILLAPDQPMTYLTRALLRLELGDDRGALADADRLAQASPDSRRFVREYARLLLPEWAFWPARERFEGEVEGIPDAPTQPLEAIRRQIQIYATRIRLLREAVMARVPRRKTAPWVPPVLEALLPEGPLALRKFDGTITDETDEGTETVSVEVDETLTPGSAGLPALMRVARSQWAALTSLCWTCGLAQVALPESIQAPAGFAAAAGAAITRFFRAQDTLATGGLRSQSAGVPGFVWEGMDIDEMPRPFVQLAVDEYFELRALYLWLLSPENLSPFQSDLRDVG